MLFILTTIVFKACCSHFRNKTNRVINNFDCSKKGPSWGEGRRTWGGNPYDGLYREAPPERGYLFQVLGV